MAATLEQFVQHLTASGLMSGAEAAAFQDTLPPDRKPKDGEDLARELVQAGNPAPALLPGQESRRRGPRVATPTV